MKTFAPTIRYMNAQVQIRRDLQPHGWRRYIARAPCAKDSLTSRVLYPVGRRIEGI